MELDLSPLWISLKVASIATVVTFFLGVFAAYWMLGYRGRGRSLIEGILIAPLILPPTVVGFLLLLLFGRNGPLGNLMQHFDFTIIFTWYAAVVAAIVVSFPLMYKTALGAFEQIDPSLLQVARTLGAGEQRVFYRILLPLATPGLVAGGTLAFARALGEFGATLMLAGNIPGETQTMPMAIYFAVEAGDMNAAWLWAIAIMTLSLSGLMVVNRWQRPSPQRHGIQGDPLESHEPVRRGGHRLPPGQLGTGITAQRRSPQTGSPQTGSPQTESPQTGSLQTGLVVAIAKQLAHFQLDTAFTAQPETLGILGGSGSGKSMLLRCIAGVETPTTGRIVLHGRTLFDAAQKINLPSAQRQVGLLFQNYALFPHMTVAQNIAFGLAHLPKSMQRQRVAQQLALVQMGGLGDRYPHQLSGGQQQRVALARALATNPEVLLLDEPFSALDTYLRSHMEQQLLETLAHYRGITLFVTHNLEEAYRLSENLLVMSAGKAIAHASKHQIFEHPHTVRVAQLTGCKNFSRAVAQGTNRVLAQDWGITLQVLEAIPADLTDIGIRAHQIRITPERVRDRRLSVNTFPCWVAATSETPHRITLFLKFNAAPVDAQDYHVQAEVFKERWHAMKDRPLPWTVQLDPSRLMLMVD